MFTKNKTFLSKSKYFLLATSSIGLLTSAGAFADTIVTRDNISTVDNENHWNNKGVNHFPKNDDNIILTGNHQIRINKDINIKNINLYGFTPDKIVIVANHPAYKVSVNDIVNHNSKEARGAVNAALGKVLAFGDQNNATTQIFLEQTAIIGGDQHISELTITGDDISAVGSILFGGGSSKLTFKKAITVDAVIQTKSNLGGTIEIEDDVVFKKAVGSKYVYTVYTRNGLEDRSGAGIYSIIVADNKSATLESNIMAADIDLKNKSKLVLNPTFRAIEVNTGIGTNLAADGDGIIEMKGSTKNTITFLNDIGSKDTRVGEITITSGKGTIFNNLVYAKSIKVASNDVEFKEKLDMQQYNLDGKGYRLALLDTGNLEFTNLGKVKFHKDFTGDITTSKTNRGIVTFVNTPDIYGIGKGTRIEQLIFEGNHIHNLHESIHAVRVDFDSGTYNIATEDVKIDGNANINGSILNLAHHNLIFQGRVEFSNNINLFVTGENKLIFENHAPTVDNNGANIIITIDGAQPADEGTALAVLQVNVKGAFPPVGSHYDAVTGILVLPGLGGAIPAGPVRAPVPVVAAPAPAPVPGGAAPPPAVVPAPAPAGAPPAVVGVPAGGGAAAPAAPPPGGVAVPAPAGAPPAVGGVPAVPPPAAPAPILVVAVAPTPAVPVVSPVIELANAISNIIVSASQKTPADKATQEVINKRAVSVMQNPEKHATELAKELASSGTDFKDAARVANDDVYVTGKTKQEQSLLFAATLSQIAPDKPEEAVKHLTDQATRSVSVANVTTEAVGANITNHLSGSNTAIAAGDEDDDSILSSKKGIWVAGTFGSSNQGIYKGGASYNGKVAGATIGGDLYIGDNGVVGIAYSNMSSNFKFTGANPGDKLSANSNVISIYGQQQFNNGFMLQGIFSGSNSKITKKDLRRVGASIYKLATGKYTSKAYAFETTVGYQVSTINDISLMPNIGIRYNSYKDEAYTETGTGVNNMYVPAKSGNMVTGIAGMKIIMSKKLSEDTQIIPGLHASIENSFNNKQQKVKARFIWADNYFENAATTSTPKVGYNLGASLLTKHKNIELLATYNCNLRSKYHSHQGSLKLKLLF